MHIGESSFPYIFVQPVPFREAMLKQVMMKKEYGLLITWYKFVF